jgi:hypothetical protein
MYCNPRLASLHLFDHVAYASQPDASHEGAAAGLRVGLFRLPSRYAPVDLTEAAPVRVPSADP